MGCDIHMHAEVKISGAWHHYNEPALRGDYQLFARMAGVRNEHEDIEPIAEPRGLPNDISLITRLDTTNWGTDGQCHSWLSGEEVEALLVWCQRYEFYELWQAPFGYIFGNGWNIKEDPEAYPEGVEDARLVFWFDNV